MDIAHDADDLGRLATTQVQALPDDVFAWEMGARERLVHHKHPRTALGVLIRHEPSRHEAQPHGVEIA